MKKRIFSLSALLLCIIIHPAFSAEKMRIVVMNLKADGVSDRTARTVSNMLRTEFINIGRFTVVERAQMDAILQEQGLQQTGCTDQECAVQLGRLMSAKKILVGEVSPIGKSIITTVRIVDVEKGVSEFAATQKAESEDKLDEAVSKIAQQIAKRIDNDVVTGKEIVKEKEKPKEAETPGQKSVMGYYMRGFVPGWGQFYAGRDIKGWIYSGLFATSSVLAILGIVNYNKKKHAYEDLGQDTSMDKFDKAYDDYKNAAGGAKAFTIFWGVVYLANWVDIIFFSKPDFGTGVSTLNYNRNFITFNACTPTLYAAETKVDLGIGVRF